MGLRQPSVEGGDEEADLNLSRMLQRKARLLTEALSLEKTLG